MAVRPDGKQIVAASIGWPFSLNIVENPGYWSKGRPHSARRRDVIPQVQVHTGVAYSPDGTLLYDATGDSGAIDIYSTGDLRHVAHISLDGVTAGKYVGSSFAASLVLSADGRLLYVIDQANWRVVVIDTDRRMRVNSVPTGVDPFAIALSPDGHHLYVTNTGLFEYKTIGGLDRKTRSVGDWTPFPSVRVSIKSPDTLGRGLKDMKFPG